VDPNQLSVEERRVLRILDKLGPQGAINGAAAISLREKKLAKLDRFGKTLVITDEGKEVARILNQG